MLRKLKDVISDTTLKAGVICLPMVSSVAFADGTAPAASGVDLSSLTNSVNFGSVLTGIMAVAVSLIALYAGSAGVRWILRMVRGA